MKRIAISDIHGCQKTFLKLLDRVGLNKKDKLFLLGDYIDRGPRSKEVIDSIMEMKEEGYQITMIRGNHEDIALQCIEDKFSLNYKNWLFHGGDKTLQSFNIYFLHDIKEYYKLIFNNLDYFIESDSYILTHAGLNFDTPEDPMNLFHSMMWVRNWYDSLNYQWLGDRYIIHGHTPITKYEILKLHENLEQGRVLNIDAGCCYQGVKGLGHLCAFDLDNKKIYFEKNIDM